MAKDRKFEDMSLEMTTEEAIALRASLYKKPILVLSEKQKREEFRLFWAREKKSYNKGKELESILWMHMKSAGFANPEKFEDGIKHFGLKKIK